jgi:hypothetical protein
VRDISVKKRAVGFCSFVFVFVFLLYACSAGVASPTTIEPPKPKESLAMKGQASPSPIQNAAEPAAPPTKPPIVRRPGAYANLDPDDDYVVGPPEVLADCEGDLKRAGVTFHKFNLAVHTEKQKSGRGLVCGAPEVVVYIKGPAKIAYNTAPILTCEMALALASFEKVLQEEAERTFKSQVIKIDQIGTYSCREVAAYPGTVSEHSYANAIDLGTFYLKNGRSLSVLSDFDVSDDEPKKAGGIFLRSVSRRANDEDIFSHVLTPFFNSTHRNHFHLDLARFRQDGTR